jgi:hypothetical protein
MRTLLALLIFSFLSPAAVAQRGGGTTPDETSPYICSSARGAKPTATLSAPFARAVVLSVSIGTSDVPIDRQTSDQIADALQGAAAAWRYACPTCSAANVLAMEIRSYNHANTRLPQRQTLIFSPLAEYLREREANGRLDLGWLLNPRQKFEYGAAVHPLLFPHGDIMERFTNRTRAPVGISLYERPSDAVRNRLCSSSEADAVMTPLKAAMRCDSSLAGAPDSAFLSITTSAKPTLCRGGLNTIACEKGNTIELITTNAFVLRRGKDVLTVLGLGGAEVDLVRVLMHEMGHWLGLPHFAEEESEERGIMLSSIQDDACIDAASLQNLGKAYERTEGMALTRASRRRR